MLDRLTMDDFTPRLGDRFQLSVAGGPTFPAELATARPAGASRPGHRAPFSLVFLARGGEVVPQQILTIAHDGMGTMELFAVPIGPDPEHGGMRYEVVFA